ncbi:MAG: hypothetical protein ACN6N0_17535 [Microvirgula sp.]
MPDALAALTWITPQKSGAGCWSLDLAGEPGWCRVHAQGSCIAVIIGTIDDDAWLVRICLWLASMRDGLDDGLWLEGDRLWLVRHHARDLSPAELEAALQQQSAIARAFRCQSSPAGGVIAADALGKRV